MFNEFEKLCNNRKSIRKFTDKIVEENKIIQILNIINRAPSAGNLQTYEVVVVKSKELRVKLSEAALSQRFISEAPVVLVFIAKPEEASKVYGERGEQLYCIQDATIAGTYGMLACEALGISSTWVGAFNVDKVKEIINCKKEEKPVTIMPIGYTLSNKIIFTKRKQLNELSREI
jgi:nitroreductase